MDLVTQGLLGTWINNQGAEALAEESAFERFVNYIVLARQHDQQFNPDDYSVGDDGTIGIDGFAISINGELVASIEELEDSLSGGKRFDASFTVMQAKRSSSFALGELSVFADTAIALLTAASDMPGLEPAAEMIKLVFSESSRFLNNPAVRLYYVTTGNWTEPAPLVSKIETTTETLKDSNLFSKIDFSCWGAKQIQDSWRTIDTAAEVTIEFDKRTTLPDMLGIDQAYLGVLPATELVRLVSDEDGDIRRTLFFDNVRDFMGENTEVNKDITATLKSDEARNFCVLNNGVTVVARELRSTGNRLTIKDFQIVNGCQTSYLVHRYQDHVSDVYVPFRLIISDDDDVTNSITKATNKQSQVTAENILALADVQKNIEAYFDAFGNDDGHRIFYERRSKQWSGVAVKGTWRVITLRNLMQSYASMFLYLPHTAARYYGDLRARVGNEVFREDQHPAYYYSAGYAFCKLDHFFSKQQISRDLKPVRYHLLCGVLASYSGSATPTLVHSTEKKANRFCTPLNKFLWDDDNFLDALELCSTVLRGMMKNGNITRDVGRTRDFTESYVQRVLEAQ